jgi:hypothetical protein
MSRRAWNGDRTIGNYPTTSEPEIAYQSFHCLKKLAEVLIGIPGVRIRNVKYLYKGGEIKTMQQGRILIFLERHGEPFSGITGGIGTTFVGRQFFCLAALSKRWECK